MQLQASDQASSDSGSEEFPVYEESQFAHSHKYMLQSNPQLSHNHNKYKNISQDTHKPSHRFSLQDNTRPQPSRSKQRQVDNQESEGGHHLHQDVQRLRLLLQKQIQNNKQLERQLFLREKELLNFRSRDKPIKKPIPQRVQSPNGQIKIKQIKQIEQELDRLKGQIGKNSVHKGRVEELKVENSKLKGMNRKYKEFVGAIASSLGIMAEKPAPKGVNQTWKMWKETFSEMAKDKGVEK